MQLISQNSGNIFLLAVTVCVVCVKWIIVVTAQLPCVTSVFGEINSICLFLPALQVLQLSLTEWLMQCGLGYIGLGAKFHFWEKEH